MKRQELTKYINRYLCTSDFSEADLSQNGLQVEGKDSIKFIATSVDACIETIEKAIKLGADALLVHHGIFWGKSLLIVGSHGRRVSLLIKNGINLYGYHLPLDCHNKVGNNAQLAKILGVNIEKPFGKYRGISIGVEGSIDASMPLAEFISHVENKLGSEVRLLHFGPDKVKKVAISSGGGASEIYSAVKSGVDAFITGEGGHIHFHQAKEERLNLIYGGHYTTETFGVKALGEHLSQKFGLKHIFIDSPTGF